MSRSASSVAVILGSAFDESRLSDLSLEPRVIDTAYGGVTLYQVEDVERPAYVLFRHGIPHRYLPHQIPYQAHAWALRHVDCGALLVTSSVGVLESRYPLFKPLLVVDLLMPENRLPDGSACTIYQEPTAEQGHLVVQEGLFSRALNARLRELAERVGWPIVSEVVFGYVGGPRTKTAAENRLWAALGAQVNSMSLGPEVVLANELEIPTAGLVVGHKYSIPDVDAPGDEAAMTESLEKSRRSFEQLLAEFLTTVEPVPFANRIHRFTTQS